MELESLFTVSKWDILTHISKCSSSPIELSKQLNTTIANISQQLRLLEFAGIVNKEKISQGGIGKPRTLYSLADDFAHVTLLVDNYANKRLISLTPHHKILFRIWFIEDSSLHYYLEKFYWQIEHLMDNISAIVVDSMAVGLTLYIVSDSKDIAKKISDTEIKHRSGSSKKILVKHLSKDELSSKFPYDRISELEVIHDPEGIFAR